MVQGFRVHRNLNRTTSVMSIEKWRISILSFPRRRESRRLCGSYGFPPSREWHWWCFTFFFSRRSRGYFGEVCHIKHLIHDTTLAFFKKLNSYKISLLCPNSASAKYCWRWVLKSFQLWKAWPWIRLRRKRFTKGNLWKTENFCQARKEKF